MEYDCRKGVFDGFLRWWKRYEPRKSLRGLSGIDESRWGRGKNGHLEGRTGNGRTRWDLRKICRKCSFFLNRRTHWNCVSAGELPRSGPERNIIFSIVLVWQARRLCEHLHIIAKKSRPGSKRTSNNFQGHHKFRSNPWLEQCQYAATTARSRQKAQKCRSIEQKQILS